MKQDEYPGGGALVAGHIAHPVGETVQFRATRGRSSQIGQALVGDHARGRVHAQYAILEALEAERDYMRILRQRVGQLLAEGSETESGVRRAARFMVERRGSDLGGRRQDLDNARRVWTEEQESPPS